jgi:subtilisin family serine protease
VAGGVAVLAAVAAFALPAAGVASSPGAGTSNPAVAASNGSAVAGSTISVLANAFGVSSHKSAGLSHVGGAKGPVIPANLLKQIQSNPKHVFNLIVQGKVGRVAALTRALHAVSSSRTGKPFKSVPGFSLAINGKDLLKVAQKYPSLLSAITVDQPMRTADYQDAQMWTTSADVAPLWNSFDAYTGQITGPAPQAPGIAFIDSGVDANSTTDFGSRVVASIDFCSLCTDKSANDPTPVSSDPVAPVSSDPVAPVSDPVAPVSDPVAPVSSDPVAPVSSDPVAPVSDPVAPVSDPVAPVSDPVAPVSSDPVAPVSSDSGSLESHVARFGTDSIVSKLSLDLEGHGTMVAGVAAGQSPVYPGVAQNAPIVSVRVANADGESLESDVIKAADWVLANKDAYGIKVVNISMAGASPTSFQFDPLDQAVERLWFSGVTVVVAAGNFGTGSAVDMSAAPGNDPFVITVGAVDQNQTSDPSDDTVAPWSAYGFTADGFSKPDISAPGRYMVMPVPADTTIPMTVPDRVVAPGYMWMSGTSFAAPVVSGAAAQILARHPDWTPDEVKGALMLTAAYLGNADWQAAGVGEVDAASAASLDFAPPNPNENLDTFLGADPSTGQPVFDAAAWASAVSSDAAWASAAWASAAWASAAWASAAWASAAWSSAAWASSVGTAMSSLTTYTEATYSP